jgi:short-subunit dehydrogenase
MARHTAPGRNWLATAGLGVGAYLAARQIVHWKRHFELPGKVVLVTGGSRGLGFLLAREFAAAGARVAICARDGDELEQARQKLSAAGHDVWTGVCDISREDQVQELVGRLRAEQGHVDVLVNNAGTITVGPAETMTLTDYQEAMGANFWGAVLMTREVIDGMRSRGHGRIVNITSIGGKCAVPHLLPYSASKFALVGWSEGLRAEAKKDGVYVTTIVPGLMRTGSPPNARFKSQHRKEYAWFAVGDSSPATSMNADRAARRIVQACVNGEAEVTLSWQAKLAARFHGLFPGLSIELASLANRTLPDEGGIGTGSRLGRQSGSGVAPGPLTTRSDAASRRNNELPA